MKYKRKFGFLKSLQTDMGKTVPLAVFALCACLPLKARPPKDRQFSIKTENLAEENRQNAVRLLKRLDKACSKIAKPRPQSSPLKLRILFVKEKLPEGIKTICLKNRRVFLYLPADTEEWMNSRQTLKSLLKIIMLCKYGMPPDHPGAKIPDWILTGLLRKAKANEIGFKTPGAKLYPGLHTLLSSNYLPDLTESLNRKLRSKQADAHSLHKEICEVLVNACSRFQTQKSDPFYESIILASNGKNNSAEIFKSAFGNAILSRNALTSSPDGTLETTSILDETRLNEWFHGEIKKAAINFLMPPSPEYAERIFRKAMSVNDGKNRYPLEELPEKSESVENKNVLTLTIIQKLRNAQNNLPPECRTYIVKIIAELEKFRMGKGEDFTKNVKAAKVSFKQTIENIKKIRALLDEEEKKVVPAYQRYSKYFMEISEIEKEKSKKDKELNLYLDRIEKEFGKEWK